MWDGNVPLHEWKHKEISPLPMIVNKAGKLAKATEPTENMIIWLYEVNSFVPCGKIVDGESFSIVTDYLGFKYVGESVILSDLSYKKEGFESNTKDEIFGNGYDWQSLAKIYIQKFKPELNSELNFDSEVDMFSITSKNEEALEEFLVGFKQICENDKLFRSLFLDIEID